MPFIVLLIENFPYFALGGMLLLLVFLFFLISLVSRTRRAILSQIEGLKSAFTHRIDEIEVYTLTEIKNAVEKLKKCEAQQTKVEIIALSEKVQRMLGDLKIRLDDVAGVCQRLSENNNLQDSVEKLRADVEEQGLYLHDQFAAVGENVRTQLQDLRDKALTDISADVREDRAQLQTAVTAMSEMVVQSVNRLTAEVDAKLALLENKLDAGIRERWSEALGSIDTLRQQLAELSAVGAHMNDFGENVKALSSLLTTRAGDAGAPPARRQLADLLAQTLPAEHYQLDASLTDGVQVAALVHLAKPRESILIDADLSLQAFVDSRAADISAADRAEKRETFGQDVIARIYYVADRLATVDGGNAMLFVASEAAFADIHADHRDAVDLAISRRIWLVSPTTLLAVLNTANMAIKDYRAQQQLQQVRESVAGIMREAQYFENRLNEVGDQVSAAWRSVRRAESAGNRLMSSVRGITPCAENRQTDADKIAE